MKVRLTSILILALLGLIVGQGLMATDAAKPSRPNVVLIISDDHAWTDYSFAGHAHAKTPNIDRLAAEGLPAGRPIKHAGACSRANVEAPGNGPKDSTVVEGDPEC